MLTPSSSGWDAIAKLPADRRDGRSMLLWEGDRPVIGRWAADRAQWEDPESMQLFEEISHWADIQAPQ